MHKLIKVTLVAALPAFWAAGCSDFLKGGELSTNPNTPLIGTATNKQLFVAIEASSFFMQEDEIAWYIAMWMQSLYGNARQMVGAYNYSSLNNGSFDGDFSNPYTGGGLVDLRVLEAQALAANDKRFYGIALIEEAWMMGTMADWWGDVPYNEADNYAQFPTPHLDPQKQVYDSVEAKLSQAITNLTLGGPGPGTVDLVYGGDSAKWGKLAHTLKARFLLHQVGMGGATYAQVLAEANLGIASNAGDYTAWHQSGVQFSSNIWWQEMVLARAGDIISGDTTVLVKMLKGPPLDPRFAEYFDSTNPGGAFLSAFRIGDGFRQPLVTYNENQLIIAEAKLNTGDAAGALVALNAEETAWNTATIWHAARAVPLSVTATTNTIMTEKYITLFQNVEVWNDWKRTCVPALTKILDNATFGHTIPSRLLYGATEQQTNPNVPAVGVGANGPWNWNDNRHGCLL